MKKTVKDFIEYLSTLPQDAIITDGEAHLYYNNIKGFEKESIVNVHMREHCSNVDEPDEKQVILWFES